MKVIAFNASPNKEAGSTALILNPLLKGLSDSGAEIELKYITDLNIEPCRACTSSILFDSSNDCQIDDDMQELYPKLNDADLLIFASPNYLNNLTNGLKNFFDRLEPLFVSSYHYEYNGCHEKIRNTLKKRETPGNVLLISTCGNWGLENFNAIVDQVTAVSDMLGREFLTPVLRDHSGVMNTLSSLGKPVNDIYNASELAGIELKKNGQISQSTLDILQRQIVSSDSFIQELSLIVK